LIAERCVNKRFPVVACASCGKSQTLSPFSPFFTDDDDEQGVYVFPGKALRSEGLFMARLSSPKKQQSGRVLKGSDPLFSVDGSWSQYGRVVPS